MSMFREKIKTREAFQWNGMERRYEELRKWTEGVVYRDKDERLMVATPEGEAKANPSDWVVGGLNGGFWVLTHEEFTDCYEPADIDDYMPHAIGDMDKEIRKVADVLMPKLLGLFMQLLKGRVDPKVLKAILREKLVVG